ncbi:hypothetical protein LINPERPRIM_LOCUS5476 [Linum perenne]
MNVETSRVDYLNSNCYVILETNQTIVRGLIRNNEDKCLVAFTKSLDKCSITRVELRDIVSGLQLAWNLGFRRVHLQLDSRCAVQLLTSVD